MRTMCWAENSRHFWTGSEQGLARLHDRETGDVLEEHQVRAAA